MSPIFVPVEKTMEIHERQMALYGGNPAVRDAKLLESALLAPMSGLGDDYFHAFPFQMAAAYLYHIVKNRPFVDGNKRTGAVTALVFLALNWYDFNADEESFERFVRSAAAGEIQKDEIAGFIEGHSRKRRKTAKEGLIIDRGLKSDD
ncbi:MAG: type II toxin-antitoxin system death-on-curing family toxin [Synergistaceae bacterium]|jgi:death-on-curing protein|nr:type II toxin-antitoxin system death-on-curing family toxin [Synergistaceae bacterium]